MTQGNVLCERAEVADSLVRRMRGLLGRSELPAGNGMLLERESSIHSAFMRFEFDVVFLDRDRRVIRLAERVRPWRALSARRARSVLELAAGEISLRGVQLGDQIAVDNLVTAETAQPSKLA